MNHYEERLDQLPGEHSRRPQNGNEKLHHIEADPERPAHRPEEARGKRPEPEFQEVRVALAHRLKLLGGFVDKLAGTNEAHEYASPHFNPEICPQADIGSQYRHQHHQRNAGDIHAKIGGIENSSNIRFPPDTIRAPAGDLTPGSRNGRNDVFETIRQIADERAGQRAEPPGGGIELERDERADERTEEARERDANCLIHLKLSATFGYTTPGGNA